ncbi:Y+L amino acid transporter 2-like [Ixodes scapularis]
MAKDPKRYTVNKSGSEDVTKDPGAQTPRLKREVGLVSATALLIGAVIGSGIFVTPSTVFRNSGSIGVVLVVWSVCGVLTLIGGLCYAELGTLLPAAGGEYAYLIAGGKWLGKFGDVVPFFHAWFFLLISDPMSAALQGLTFSSYILSIVYRSCPPPYAVNVLVALAFTSLATLINCISVKTSARVQDVLSSIKCLVLLSIIITGVISAFRENHLLDKPFFTGDTKAADVVFAFYGAIYSYGGWSQITHIAEEIKNPTRNIPWALIFGIFIITLIYIGTNVAYFVVLDAPTIASTDAIAVSFTAATWGPLAATVIPICVAVSCFGTLCAGYFSSARVMLAAGRQGHLPLIFSFITVETSLPLTSILLRGCLAVGYTFVGSVEALIVGAVFLASLAGVFVVLTLFVLRFTMEDAPRPYRVPTVLAVIKLVVLVALIVLPFLKPVEYLQYVVIMAVLTLGGVYYVLFTRFELVFPGSRQAACFVQKLLMCVPCVNELELMLKEKL